MGGGHVASKIAPPHPKHQIPKIRETEKQELGPSAIMRSFCLGSVEFSAFQRISGSGRRVVVGGFGVWATYLTV